MQHSVEENCLVFRDLPSPLPGEVKIDLSTVTAETLKRLRNMADDRSFRLLCFSELTGVSYDTLMDLPGGSRVELGHTLAQALFDRSELSGESFQDVAVVIDGSTVRMPLLKPAAIAGGTREAIIFDLAYWQTASKKAATRSEEHGGPGTGEYYVHLAAQLSGIAYADLWQLDAQDLANVADCIRRAEAERSSA